MVYISNYRTPTYSVSVGSGQNLPVIASPPAIASPPSPAQEKPRKNRGFSGFFLAAGDFISRATGAKFRINPLRISKSHKSAEILGFQLFRDNSGRRFSSVGSSKKSSTDRKHGGLVQRGWWCLSCRITPL